jgi:hypothetical protein
MPDPDTVFQVLRCRRRRLAIRVLAEADGSMSLGELAERVAAREAGIEPRQITSAQRKNVYTALYQSHLSVLDDGGALTLVDGQDAIRAGPAIATYRRQLRTAHRGPTLLERARDLVHAVGRTV